MSANDPYALDRSVMMRGLSQIQLAANNHPKTRREMAQAYAKAIARTLADPTGQFRLSPTHKGTEYGRELTEKGLVQLGQVLNPAQVNEIVTYFKSRPTYASHVATQAKEPPAPIDDLRKRVHYGSYDISDILRAPYLLEIANSPDFLATAAEYLGCVPSIYAVNCWWTFGGHTTLAPVAQKLHRDPDDFRFCTLFVYLTDVGADGGPHIYVTDSHNCDRFDPELHRRLVAAGMKPEDAQQMVHFTYFQDGNAAPLDDMIGGLFPERIRTLTGSAGSALMEDTYGLHRGAAHSRTDRLMFWARYGLGPNLAYDIDKTHPRKIDWQNRLPATPVTRYVNRLLIDMR